METMYTYICGVCGKQFNKDYLLRLHKKKMHIMEFEQNISTPHSSTQLNIPGCSNYGNVGGGVPGGGHPMRREINGNEEVAGYSGTVNQHQHPTFSGSETAAPSSCMGINPTSDDWNEKLAEFIRMRQQINQGTHSHSQGGNIARQLNTMRLDDGKERTMIRVPSSSGAKAGSSVNGEASAVHLNPGRATDGSINVPTASGGPQIGFIQQSSRVSSNYATNGLSAIPQETKPVAGTRHQALPPYEPQLGKSGTGIVKLMNNLKAMQLLARGQLSPSTNLNKKSSSRVNEKACSSTRTGSNPTQVIPPSNRVELEKREKRKETHVKQEQAETVVPEQDQKFSLVHEHIVPQGKNYVPAAEGNVKEGKTPIPKKNLERNKRFLPSQSSPIEGNGIRSTPSQPSSGEFAPSTSSAMRTITKSAATATVTVSAAGNVVELVAKPTAPTSKSRGGRAKVSPQKTNPNSANNDLNPIKIEPAAKNDKEVQRNRKSTKLAHERVVPPTSSSNGGSKKSAVAEAASAAGRSRRREVVAKKSTIAPKKPPPSPITIKKETEGMKVTLAQLKKIVPTMPGTNYRMPDLSGIGSYTDKWGTQYWICLVCNQEEPDESSKDMICCDECDNWYHFECVGIIEDVIAEDDPWYCKICISKACGNKKGVFPEILKND